MAEQVHRDSLSEEATRVLEEARTVLPGLQAIFGFQLIAVFNQRFDSALTSHQQILHFVALVMVALAGALLMVPAAYQRQAEPGLVTRRFVTIASRMIFLAMIPLAVGLTIDVFLLGCMIFHDTGLAILPALVLFGLLVVLWFVWPHLPRKRLAEDFRQGAQPGRAEQRGR